MKNQHNKSNESETYEKIENELRKCLLLGEHVILTYLLTPWSRVLLEKLTSKLCS